MTAGVRSEARIKAAVKSSEMRRYENSTLIRLLKRPINNSKTPAYQENSVDMYVWGEDLVSLEHLL